MYYVYILLSNITHKLYKGSTSDLKNRLTEHNSGSVTATKSDKPWRLIYYEAFTNKTDALREELFIKSGKGRDRVKYLLLNSLENGQDGNALVSKTNVRKD